MRIASRGPHPSAPLLELAPLVLPCKRLRLLLRLSERQNARGVLETHNCPVWQM